MNLVMPLLIAGLLAAPLGIDDPGGKGGVKATTSQDGNTVGAELVNSRTIVTGSGVKAGKSDGFRIKRPCWYEPGLDAEQMLKFQTNSKVQASRILADEKSFVRFVQQFKDKVGQPGLWWTPAYNAADPQGAACWAGLELFLFVPPNQTPPSGITLEQLAEIARAAMTVPEPVVKLNPNAKSYVNLPTWVALQNPGEDRLTVTATLPGVMSVTLAADREDIEIDAGTGADRAEVHEEGCGKSGTPYVANGPFTCGVRYLRASLDQPREEYRMTVTTVWRVTVVDQVVPAQFAPVRAAATLDVPVGEVQSNVRP
jgi:enoyl reductase